MNEIEINNILNIDIDKYIEWYKNECTQSEYKRWLEYELFTINNLRSQTNFYCGTFKNIENAKKYQNRIQEIYGKRVKEFNSFNQSIYHPTEWLVLSSEQWDSFDRSINKNPHTLELDRLLSLCKDTKKAKEYTIQKFIEKLSNENIKNFKCIDNAKFIELDFFDKGSYYANENPEFMGYCQEHAFFSLIYDYYIIKAMDYANSLLELLENNKELPNDNELTQKQVALLCYYMKLTGILHPNKIHQDATKQCIFICKIFNIKVTGKINDSNFYKYWNSIYSVSDNQNVITKENLKQILKYSKDLNINNLTQLIEKDLIS